MSLTSPRFFHVSNFRNVDAPFSTYRCFGLVLNMFSANAIVNMGLHCSGGGFRTMGPTTVAGLDSVLYTFKKKSVY